MRAALALVLLAAPAFAQTAQELNARGFELYKKQQYGEAIEAFRAAIEKDEKHAFAHYNLAATLALMRTKGKVCDFDAYRGTITRELARAIGLDPRRRKRALADTDFASVQDTFAWQAVVLQRTAKKDAAAILQAVSWYGPSPGAYGPLVTFRFKPGGVLEASYVNPDMDPPRKQATGRWTLKGATVDVEYPRADEKAPVKRRYTLTDDGKLVGAANPADTLGDDPSDCDA